MIANNFFPLVSIVVPVYKVEKYLRECLDSFIVQDYENFEVVLVDDGSPDGSGVICDEYVAKDNRFRVFHKDNAGVTKARSLGVAQARGEWIMFVDSDDTIPVGTLRSMLSYATADGCDAVVANFQRFTPDPQRKGCMTIKGMKAGIDFADALLTGKCTVGVLGKIFRKHCFDAGTMNVPADITNNEDLLMNLRLARNCRKVMFVPDLVVYNYYLRPGSASKTILSTDRWDRLYEELQRTVPEGFERQYWTYVVNGVTLLTLSFGYDFRGSKTLDRVQGADIPLTAYHSICVRLVSNPTRTNKRILSLMSKAKKLGRWIKNKTL